MFPLNDETILNLLLAGAAMVIALAFLLRSRALRGLVILAAAALPWTFLWVIPPVGDHAGLIYVLVGAYMMVALIVGGVVGIALRRWRGLRSAAFILGLTSALGAYELWRQYVPETCDRIDVSIGGEKLTLPAALRPRLWPPRRSFGHEDRHHWLR